MYIRKVLSNGHITIPVALRKKYDLTPGTKVILHEENGVIKIIRNVTKRVDKSDEKLK